MTNTAIAKVRRTRLPLWIRSRFISVVTLRDPHRTKWVQYPRRAGSEIAGRMVFRTRMSVGRGAPRALSDCARSSPDPACYGLLPELARCWLGTSKDAATEEPK